MCDCRPVGIVLCVCRRSSLSNIQMACQKDILIVVTDIRYDIMADKKSPYSVR